MNAERSRQQRRHDAVADWFLTAKKAVGGWFVGAVRTVGEWVSQVVANLRKFSRRTIFSRRVRKTLYFLQHITLPGNRGVSVYDVLRFFLVGIFNGDINQRAKGLAYSFMTAMPPLLIFFFTLVAYFPVDGLQNELLMQLGGILPERILTPVSDTINDIMGHRHTTLLSVGFISSVVLAANGLMGMMTSLNFAHKGVEKRPYVQRYMLSVLMVFVLYITVVLMLGLLIGHKLLLQLIYSKGWLLNTRTNTLLFNVGRWTILSLSMLFTLSFIYYWAPAKKQRVGFFSSGSVLATGMFFVLTWALGIYLNNFSRYNLLYGSIGTLLMIMFWVYFSCIVVLVGYELNISIYNGTLVKKNRENRRQIRQWKKNIYNDYTERTRKGGD